MKIKKIYLAHSGQEKEQGEEIQHYLEIDGFEVINPFHKENPYIHDLKWVNGHVDGSIDEEACKWIVETDLHYIDECDAVVMIYPKVPIPTIGTPCEMLYAFQKKKPLFVYTAQWLIEHPWIKHMATLQFSDVFGLMSFMDLIAMEDFEFDIEQLTSEQVDS